MTSTRASIQTFSRRATNACREALRRLYMSEAEREQVVTRFGEAYAAAAPTASWMGEPVSAVPLDLWIYQEIVHDTGPELILAVDTASAGYLADLCRMRGRGEVLAIGQVAAPTASRPRLRVATGSPVAPGTLAVAAEAAAAANHVLAVLGSGAEPLADHLARYAPLVSIGGYLVVEDTRPEARAVAVTDFLHSDRSFVADQTREKLYLTSNAGGYLERMF